MIERIRLALRPWANRETEEEVSAAHDSILRDYFGKLSGDMEVASWHYEPPPEEVPGARPPDKVQLGNHAKRLLDDPVMRLALEHVTADLMKTWRETAAEDREKREDAYRMLRALDGVEFKLRRFAGNAALIAAEQRRKDEAQSHANR